MPIITVMSRGRSRDRSFIFNSSLLRISSGRCCCSLALLLFVFYETLCMLNSIHEHDLTNRQDTTFIDSWLDQYQDLSFDIQIVFLLAYDVTF